MSDMRDLKEIVEANNKAASDYSKALALAQAAKTCKRKKKK